LIFTKELQQEVLIIYAQIMIYMDMKCNRLKVQFFTKFFAPFESSCVTLQPQQENTKLK